MTEAAPAGKMKIASGARDSAQARLSELTNLLLPFAIRGLATLGVADVLAAGPRPVEDIAKAVGADPSALYRTMRYTASRGVFAEFPGRVFALTSLANWLRTDIKGSMRARLLIDDGLVTRLKVFAETPHTLHTGEPAYQKVTGTDPFGASAADRALAMRYHRQLRPGGQTWPDRLVDEAGLPGEGVVVDIGGGTGTALGRILDRHPGLTGVLLDLPPVVDEAVGALREAGVEDRVRLVGGDMFAEVPAGADVYLMSFVLHDWPDERVASLLATIRTAMRPDSRLLVVESLIAEEGEQAAQAVQQDFMMLLNGGGRERTEEEHAALAEDAGLAVRAVVPLGPGVSVLDVRVAAEPEK